MFHVVTVLVLLILWSDESAGARQISHADSLLKARKHFSFAVQYKKAGAYDEAELNYERSLAFNDSVYQVQFSYADMLLDLDRPADARRRFLEAFMLQPGHLKSAAMLARLYHEAAIYDSALVMYRAMDRIEPGNPDVLAAIGGLGLYLGDTDTAYRAYTALLDSGHVSYDTALQCARLAAARNDPVPAKRYALMAHGIDGATTEPLLIAARCARAADSPREAIDYLLMAAGNDTTDVAPLAEAGALAKTVGDDSTLVAVLLEHHRRAPEDRSVLDDLIDALIRTDRASEALPFIREGLRLEPGDGRLRILLGEQYRRLGENRKAVEQYRMALGDEAWKEHAQRFIWAVERPESDAEKAEREFFGRARTESGQGNQ